MLDRHELERAVEAGRAGREALVRLELASGFSEQTVADLKTSLGVVANALLELSAAVNHIVDVLGHLSVRKTTS